MIMNKYKVLIVDDIPENIQNLGEMIKDFDLDVKIAEGGPGSHRYHRFIHTRHHLARLDDASCEWIGRDRTRQRKI